MDVCKLVRRGESPDSLEVRKSALLDILHESSHVELGKWHKSEHFADEIDAASNCSVSRQESPGRNVM